MIYCAAHERGRHEWPAVYLRPADKYHRFTRRLSQGQKGLEERTIWHHGGPLNRVDVLEAGRTNARRLLRPPPFAVPHYHFLLTDPLAAATAGRETTAPHAASRHDRSSPLPWLASAAATTWPSRCRWWARAVATVGVSWHVGGKSYSTCDIKPAAGVRRPRPCRAWRHAVP